MTDNRNAEAAWAYHEATKHSYLSIRANPHFLDWANQPLPFKIYPTLERLRLPGEVRPSGIAALSAIAKSVPAETVAAPHVGAAAHRLSISQSEKTRLESRYIPPHHCPFCLQK